MFGLGKKKEERVTQATSNFAALVGKGLVWPQNASGQTVNSDTALQVPAVWAAINFISGTIAGLPLHVYERTETGREKFTGPISWILHDAVSDEMTSYEWRKYTFERVLTAGRAFSLILRNGRGEVAGLMPLDPEKVEIERVDGLKFYVYKENGAKRRYSAAEIIDVPFMLKSDGLSHISPLTAGKDAIGLGLAVQEYAGRFFASGGVPPFAVSGNFQSGASLNRAADDLEQAVKKASSEGRQALMLPRNLEITKIGADPEQTQLLETQKFIVEQVARLFSLPPTFLQDLSHGTFSNTEQQDLQYVKHTLKRWIEQFEQELNLKLWGRRNRKYFAEFSVDGLLRGDFKTRMEGHARAIQGGFETPNEARELENRPPLEGGNRLYVQGATVPLENAGQIPQADQGTGNET